MSILFKRASFARIGFAIGVLAFASASALAQEDKTVATINGKTITESDLAMAEGELSQQFAKLPPQQRRAAALSAMIEIDLLSREAVEKGLDKDPDFVKRMNFLKQRALQASMIDKEVGGNITDEEIRARYDKEVAATPPTNEVHARHILVKTKEEAEAIIKQLDAGADFEKLANENTTDKSGKTSGGDLGYFGPGQMVPEFEKAAFALEPGEYTKEPVKTDFGWHVIKVEDKRVQQPPAFEDVKEQFRSLVLREKYFALVKSLREAAKIDIADPELKKMLDAMQAQQ